MLSYSPTAVRVVRYQTDGALDTSFGSGGVVEVDPGYSSFYGTAIKLQSDGKIVVGGVMDSGSGNDVMVARICP